MADRTRDRYQNWGVSRLLAALLTELENVVSDGLNTNPTPGATPDQVEIQGLINDTDLRTLRVDPSSNSLQIIDYAHHEIHGGSHYFVVGTQDLTAGDVLDFQWTIPDTTKWIHWVWSIDCEDEVEWFVYEGVTITNPLANDITPLNSNRNSVKTSGTTMKFELHGNLAAANADTDVSAPAILLKTGKTKGGGFFTPGGGQAGRESEVILKQDTVYCLRAIAGGAGFINFDMEWYEHTDKD